MRWQFLKIATFMLRLHPFPNHSGGKLCIFASVCAVFHLCRVSTKHLKRQFRTWTKLSHLTRSQTKHQADSTTQGPILLSTIIYICLIEQKGFFFFCHSSVIRHATCLSAPSSRGERPREKRQGAMNPVKSDSLNLGNIPQGARSCREICWPKPLWKGSTTTMLR